MSDGIQAGIKLNFDGDGIRDQLVFLYGFLPNNPLTVLAFKFDKEYEDYIEFQPSERISPISRVFQPEEVFSSGEYPIIQNSRFVSVADFNNDGVEDVFVSDGGYERVTSQCNRDAPTNANNIHLVQEESTGKRYLGIWSSNNWDGGI